MEDCIEVILDGVENVPIYGTRGSLVVFGENALPVLCNSKHEVLIAAATFGEGRIVVFPHTSYLSINNYRWNEDVSDDLLLYKNISKWVTKGCFSKETKVMDIKEIEEEIPKGSLLIWNSGVVEDELKEKLLSFLKSGGAMVVGTTPWGFLQLNSNYALESIPVNMFTKEVGICFTPCYYGSSGQVCVKENCASHSHLLHALKDSEDSEVFNCCSAAIQANLQWFPEQEFCQMENQIHTTIEKMCTEINCCPTPNKPAQTSAEKALVTVMSRAFKSFDEERSLKKLPSVEVFPGDLPPDVPTECAEVKIDVPEHKMRCYHPTGYYVPAGQELIIRLQDVELPGDDYGWTVAIGSHTDELFATDAPWRRWPTVQVSMTLMSKESALKTPSGGLVYFVSDQLTNASLNATLENVVKAPYYDVNNEDLKADWLVRRESPGLWADLVGHHFMLTVPASSVRSLENPEEVVGFWDSLAETHFSLAGVDLKQRRREWVVTDEQPRAGYMHAGYPIVTCLDVAVPAHEGASDVSLLNVQGLTTKGSWGMFHELGHNLQDPMWTFEGTGEVTCNIFTLYAMDVHCGKKPWIHPWLERNLPAAERYLKDGESFERGWQGNPHVGLFIYAQLARDFGWDAFKRVFQIYRELEGHQRPSGFQNQVDYWVTCFSKVSGQNLCPLFQLWGFPLSDSVNESLSDLPLYVPSDEIANMVPERVEKVMALFNAA